MVGDAASFTFPTAHFDYVLHFATASAAEVSAGGTAAIMHTLAGTQRVLEFARSSGARRLLFASSGAVYGRQPPELERIPEDFRGGPDLADPASAYGEMKRLAELMCTTTKGVECVVARGFSFVGPYLPLTDKFAVGSFIRDALAGGPIRIHGDGKPLRSYMYATDLAIWLLTLLVRGRTSEPYNVGSDLAINLEELARNISSILGGIEIQIEHTQPLCKAERYIPDTDKARTEFGLHICPPLSAALVRTITHAQEQSWTRP